ncbi:MAG: HAMP domain-containing sensor histidine kinase [Alistipes sp.]
MTSLLLISIALLALLSIMLVARLRVQRRFLLKTNDLTELLLKNIDVYALLVDPDFNVLRTNYYALTGTTTDLVPPKVGNLLHCKNGEDAGVCGTHEFCTTCPVRAAISEAFRTHKNFSRLEAPMELYTSSDHSKVVNCEISASGNLISIYNQPHMLLTLHDITAQKNMMRELDETRIRAEESDRMKSLFLANTSHELRTPLNAIVGFSELLIADNSAEEKREYARIIRTNNELLLQLVNDILDMSKIEAGTLKFNYDDEELNTIMEELEGACCMKQQADSPVCIKFLRQYPSCRIHTDGTRLRQVILNLLSNAIKFTEKGEIVFGFEMHDKELYFYVRDTGIGIKQKNLELVFKRFVTIGFQQQGVGIGLSICKSIVESMGGQIGVESEEGKGATFWFTLPHVAPKA